MAALRNDNEALIREKPIPSELRAIALEVIASERDDSACRDCISRLLLLLLGHPVARGLRFAHRPVNAGLASVYAKLQSGDFDLLPFKSLTVLILDDANDSRIWQAVLDLLLTFSRTSPPPLRSVPLSFNSTPRTHSSASFRNSIQTREELEEPLRRELTDCTYVDVQGFFNKYFENKSWSNICDRVYTQLTKDTELYTSLNKAHPEEKDIWEWLDKFQKKYLTEAAAPGVYYQAKSKADIKDAQGERQLDVFLKNRGAPIQEPHSVRDLRVIGELTKSPKTIWKEKYLQLAVYVRDIFAAQPSRWFIHGFLMFGPQIQLWIYDRSGAYCAEMFDIREDMKRFVKVIVGYAMMSDSELGLNPIVKHDGLSTSVTVIDANTGKDLDLQLESAPFVSQATIVSRGTACYYTLDGSSVVKMSWRPDKPRSEIALLTRARGVKGVPQLLGSRDMISIKELRSNLEIKTKRKLEPPRRSGDSPASSLTSQSTHAIANLNMSGGGNKRKSDSTDKLSFKKRRSSQRSNLRSEAHIDDDDSTIPNQSVTRADSSSPDRSYRNRILTCLVIKPAGRPLQCFRSVLEVLEAFYNTIEAHQSLFLDRNILHRDVSMNNIILTDPAQNNGCTGMLIDLDLAVLVGKDGKNETSQTKGMTGTLEYMAIQILENEVTIEHTYRHDLESFFYVFLALCICYGWSEDTRFHRDALRTWYTGDLEAIGKAKRGELEPGGFEIYLLSKFSPTFQGQKDLARRWRRVLFGGGALYVETPETPELLYKPILEALKQQIHEMKW